MDEQCKSEISSESQKVHFQQNEENECFSNLKTKIETKQETWDANIISRNIKSDPPNLDAALIISSGATKCDVGTDIKVEHFYQVEISTELQKLHLLQSRSSFVEYNDSSDVNTMLGIKQETRDHNAESSNINPESPSRCVGTGTTKDEEIGINEEPWWCDGISTDLHNEEKETKSDKHEASKDMLPLELTRLPINDTYPNCNDINSIEIEDGTAFHETVDGMNASQAISMRQNMYSPNCNITCDIHRFESEQNLDDESVPGCKSNVYEKCCRSLDTLLHLDKNPYKCERCAKCFSDKSNLKRHFLLHSGTKPFKCDICEKCFSEKSNLVRHMLLHTGTKPFKCDTCQKCFTWKSDLKRHILLHSGKKPHKCDICKKCYAQKSTLQGHKLVHSGTKPYKCDICEKSFTHRSNLQGHKLLHSSISQYNCDICEKGFIWKSHLQRHTLLHSGKKPYKCDKCDNCFKDKSNLRQHILVHSGAKPYKCTICEKCFTKKSGLKRHSVVHSDKNL